MAYENLLTKRKPYTPYIHSRALTFNIAARKMDIGEYRVTQGKRKIESSLSYLEAHKKEALDREKQFYKEFNVNDAAEWGQKYLASSQEGTTLQQIALDVWNSHGMINLLVGLLTPEEIRQKLENDIQLRNLIGESEIDQIIQHISEYTGEKIIEEFQKILLQKDKKTQLDIRAIMSGVRDDLSKSAFMSKKRQLKSSTKSGTAYKEIRKYLTSAEVGQRQENARKYFKDNFKKKAEEKGYSSKSKEFLQILQLFEDALDKAIKAGGDALYKDLLSYQNNIVGAVAEVGESIVITYTLLTNQGNFNKKVFDKLLKEFQQGKEKVNRLGLKNKQGKADLILDLSKIKNNKGEPLGSKWRIQEKNTDKDIFFDLETRAAELETDPFFKAHGQIKYQTFLDDIEKMSKKLEKSSGGVGNNIKPSEDSFAKITYLLANINVLNTSEPIEEPYSRAYKQKPTNNSEIGTKGQLVTRSMEIVNRLMSQFALFALADFTEGEKKDFFKVAPWDFLIFDSRILVPLSVIYQGLIDNIRQTDAEINQESAHLSVQSTINRTFNLKNIRDEKKKKVGYFDPLGNYSSTALVNYGKEIGQEAVSNLVLTSFNFDVNWRNLVSKNFFPNY